MGSLFRLKFSDSKLLKPAKTCKLGDRRIDFANKQNKNSSISMLEITYRASSFACLTIWFEGKNSKVRSLRQNQKNCFILFKSFWKEKCVQNVFFNLMIRIKGVNAVFLKLRILIFCLWWILCLSCTFQNLCQTVPQRTV